MRDLKIIPLYADKSEESGYGDISSDPADIERDHPGATVLQGWGILDTTTGYVVSESEDIYFTREDAERGLQELQIRDRLEYLRGEIEAERISYSEIAELQGLTEYIDPADVLLLQWAGVPEFEDED